MPTQNPSRSYSYPSPLQLLPYRPSQLLDLSPAFMYPIFKSSLSPTSDAHKHMGVKSSIRM